MKIVKLGQAPKFYLVWQALFSGAKEITLNGIKYPISRFGQEQNGLPGVDVGNVRIVVQNPNTASEWAKLAKRGAKIAWAIDKTKQSGMKWLGRIVDGHCYRATKTPNGIIWDEVTWEGHHERNIKEKQ